MPGMMTEVERITCEGNEALREKRFSFGMLCSHREQARINRFFTFLQAAPYTRNGLYTSTTARRYNLTLADKIIQCNAAVEGGNYTPW